MRNLSYTASENEEDEERAFWDECDKVAKKNPVPSRDVAKTDSNGGTKGDRGGGGNKKKANDRDEVRFCER